MASDNLLLYILPIFATLLATAFAKDVMHPFPCSGNQKCNALLYHIETGIPKEKIASYYSVNSTQFSPILHGNRQDYLITVPCSCLTVNGTTGYFYDTLYTVEKGDIFVNVSANIYSGQAWPDADVEKKFIIGNVVPMHLLCGCVEADSQVVVTYTVQPRDTLSDIADLLSSTLNGIQSLNSILLQNPSFIDVGWVLFVPKEKFGRPSPSKVSEKKPHWVAIIAVLATVALLLMTVLIFIILRRDSCQKNSEEDPRTVSKSLSHTRASSLRDLCKENLQDVTAFESERPVEYEVEEIEEATNNFDEVKKLGQGGFGSVYFGLLRGQEVAIKKMKSNKSKEFFAELKVLCRIHHINVVELLGYASGDDNLYLVYEYVPSGSLTDHLHEPLLKSYQPLSWMARVQIAMDAAKGIEYIHDHTKARYVHRDIKSSNILLDDELRAKVADFGLAKLVERTNDEDLIATRLVGTPGYLPPESLKELQVTTKTDVFAFGVVLAELITGHRALIREKRELITMKSLITVVYEIFDSKDPENALEEAIDRNLQGSYPMKDVYKLAEIADWCLSEDATDRPEMREVVEKLSKIKMSSGEWKASLDGASQVFSGTVNER